jgi:hypothetical protein
MDSLQFHADQCLDPQKKFTRKVNNNFTPSCLFHRLPQEIDTKHCMVKYFYYREICSTISESVHGESKCSTIMAKFQVPGK